MDDNKLDLSTIDGYIALHAGDFQARLTEVRRLIHEAAPDASEKISWRMPTFYLFGNLIHFAAFKQHIGLYPGSDGIEAFKTEFDSLKLHYSKGALQMPMNQPLPADLIRRIVLFRVAENLKAIAVKPAKKTT